MLQVWYYRIAGRPLSEISRGDIFLSILLFLTFLPFVLSIVAQLVGVANLPNNFIVVAMGGLAVLSGTHVFATSYLLVDKRQLVGVKNIPLNIIAIPLAIVFVNYCSQFFFSLEQLITFLVLYMFYGVYHFGRQNLGVHAFCCLIAKKRPMHPTEKRAINIGVFSGVVAAAGAVTPLIVKNNGLDPTDYQEIFGILHAVAGCGYLVAAIYVGQLIFRNREQYSYRVVASLLIGTFFFLPVYFSQIFAGLAAVAHGLQYLVFLAFHALAARKMSINADQSSDETRNWRHLLPIALYVGMIYLGYMIWQTSAELQSSQFVIEDFLISNEALVKASIVAINGITMAHYWIDQHLWRFSNEERRKWLACYYPFIVPKRR